MKTYLFVVDLDVTDSDFDCLIKLLAGFVVDLLNGSWDNSLVLLTVLQAKHWISFTGTSLSIAHNRTVIPSYNTLDKLICCNIIYISLGGVMEDAWELKLPVIKTVVYYTLLFLVDEDVEFLQKQNMSINQIMWWQLTQNRLLDNLPQNHN